MWQQLSAQIKNGDIKSLARAISFIENEYEDYVELLKLLPSSNKKIIGITGPPGAGKSTLTDGLINTFITQQKKVAVLCIDPSSPFTHGALLGDRIRMNAWFNNPNVYIRSLASRGNASGLHPKIIEITDLLKAAPFDVIIIETVGAGQTETAIAALADVTIVVLVPEAGDEIQNMKAGLMEIADIFIVNKADRPEADLFEKNLLAMLQLSINPKQKNAPVIKTVATEKKGIDALIEKIESLETNEQSDNKKFSMYAAKAYELIQHKRMKNISVDLLEEKIRELSTNQKFNLYKFVEDFKL